jgi:amino-acid N-acetyltransferase
MEDSMTAPVPAPVTAATSRPAEAGDLPAVKELLSAVSLPWDGLTDFFPGSYVVATSGGALVGVAGLEIYGTHGLLRSVAVLPAARGHGLGAALVRDRMAGGRAAGLQAIHLLTADAAGFFSRLGFTAVERATFPDPIRASVLFCHACQPEHVAAMSHALDEGHRGSTEIDRSAAGGHRRALDCRHQLPRATPPATHGRPLPQD